MQKRHLIKNKFFDPRLQILFTACVCEIVNTMREKELDFSFRKERYKVHLCGLEIFPQGLAAVHNQGSMPGMNMLVDIGNGTMSILEIHDGRPMENSISTEVFGVPCSYQR